MSMESRAAQFAPFAALTGHNAAISETARQTSQRIELSADELAELSENLSFILMNPHRHLPVTIVYFKKDKFKDGGEYISICAKVHKYDEMGRRIILENNSEILLDDIIRIKL